MRATAALSARVASAPTKSSTTSAPRLPVAARMASRVVSSESMVISAPYPATTWSASGRVSTATTRAAVVGLRICTAMWPSPPTPITTTVDPGTSWGQLRRTAWYGVSPASVKGAADAGSKPSGSGTKKRGDGTSWYSAMPPSSPRPPPPIRDGSRGRVLAQGVHAQQAMRTPAAAPGSVDDRLPNFEALYPLAHLVDPSGVLVTEGERRSPRGVPHRRIRA